MEHEAATLSVSRRNLYILALLWSFVGGVLVSSFVTVSPLFAVFLIALSGAILAIEKLYKRDVVREVVLLVCILCAFGIGVLRYDVKDFHELQVPSSTGMVASEPEHRDTDTQFVFEADNGERALVSTDMYSRVMYGDNVSVVCKFEQPGVISENSGREFDYAKFLSKDDIYHTCNFAKVSKAAPVSGANVPVLSVSRRAQVRLVSFLLHTKGAFVQRMKSILPEPESSLLAGLIVAGKQALPKSVLEDFKGAGVVHIVVLSGYNITVVVEFFLVLLGFMSLRKRTAVASSGILLFVLMAGANASIVRAALMALVVLLGRMVHRSYSASRTLLIVAVAMIVWNPKTLVFDPSFQLSFLAMLALIYVEPLVSRCMSFITERYGLRTLLSVTIATQVTVLPYLLYNSGSVSVVSLVSNVLILGIVPFTMLIGFIATLLALVSTVLAWPFALLSHILLAWILGVAHVLGTLPWATVQVSHFGTWAMFLLYAVLIATVWHLRSSSPPIAS